jgi:iron complex outermembrane receptor protein
MSFSFDRSAVGAALALLAGAAAAQPATPPAATLREVTVIGNPLGSADLIAPADQYSGTSLLLRSHGTLGETLDRAPGISSTYFGPAASRPVIRGLDGDRIRILQNGGALLDASSISYDHAVAADPIAIERIEVLRGPGALLYGGSAIGGAVNVIDHRIPREPMAGVAGKADASWASTARERAGAVLVEGGNERFGLHVDASRRQAGDMRVPLALACTRGGASVVRNRICNSASDATGAALGGSLFFDHGYLGASVSGFRTDYGSVAEDEVTIAMKSRRTALAGEWRKPAAGVEWIKATASHTHYRHTEFEAGEAGTEFKLRGNDLRLEARHARIGALEGVIGFQADATRLAAEGEEAFVPAHRTRQQALFAFEELATSWGKLSLGARTERVKVDTAATARSMNPWSLALGSQWKLAPSWSATGHLARSERAPTGTELFANGPHVATGAYELGNAALGKERATQLDVGVAWKDGPHQFALNAFASRFSSFIGLLATGATRELDGEAIPEYAYQAVKARFRGLEASGKARLLAAGPTIDLELRGDLVRADNLTTSEPLPRIAPMRVGATLVASEGPWGARLGLAHAARQDRVPVGEQPVASHTLWHAALTYRVKAGPASLLWYARLENMADRLAYSATSILTQSAPGRVPLPGRNLKVGLQAAF